MSVPPTVLEKVASAESGEQAVGVKMPYFHRVLSEEDQKLLKKNEPQRIDNLESNSCSSSSSSNTDSNAKFSTASAWNAADSWEERDATVFCLDLLCNALGAQETSPELARLGVRINVDNDGTDDSSSDGGNKRTVDGSASVTHVRGRARYMYELSFEVEFEYVPPSPSNTVGSGAEVADDKRYSGVIKVIEAHNDQPDDELDLELSWNTSSNGGIGSPSGVLLKEARKSLFGTDIRKQIRRVLNDFESRFCKL